MTLRVRNKPVEAHLQQLHHMLGLVERNGFPNRREAPAKDPHARVMEGRDRLAKVVLSSADRDRSDFRGLCLQEEVVDAGKPNRP